MVNKKRGIMFGIFFLLIFMSFSFVSSIEDPDTIYSDCYVRSSITNPCEAGYYEDGQYCCVNPQSTCSPHDNTCDDGNVCTNDDCLLAIQDSGYTGSNYYVCYQNDKCPQDCDATTGVCYDSVITYCNHDQYVGNYTGCSGSWQEDAHCSGSWCECVSDGGGDVPPGGVEVLSFLATLTGKVVSFFEGEKSITGQVVGDLTPVCDCGGCEINENCITYSCSGASYDDCYYQDNNKDGGEGCEWVSSQEILCSDQGYNESECEDNPYCTPVYDCLLKKDNAFLINVHMIEFLIGKFVSPRIRFVLILIYLGRGVE
jgi:hypothetical protein